MSKITTDTLKRIRNEIDGLVKDYCDLKYLAKDVDLENDPVPVSGKVIGYPEISNMVSSSLDGWLTTGRFNDAFERKLGEFLDVKHVLSVNSGSSANLVAFSTLTSHKLGERAIKPGDEIIGVAAGFPTTINPQIQFGAVPVFVDVDINTHNIDITKLEGALSTKTKAVMLAHALGNPFNLRKVREFCDSHNLWLIEDCCDALGATHDGKLVGSFGDIATLSFYPAHHITMGEGGAVFTNNDELATIAESFRDWGRDCYCKTGCDNTCGKRFDWALGELPVGYDHKYVYSHCGYNLKITDMQAACGLAQLDRLEQFIEARNKNFDFLYQRLAPLSEYFILPQATENSKPSWFGFPLSLKETVHFNREDLMRFLDQEKIGTRLVFAGNVIKQPYFTETNINYRIAGTLTNTDKVMSNSFWVGLYPGLTDAHLSKTCDKIEEFLGLGF
jgi:CDP-4-dehydro-6-deoxyglucose reductase, E1